MECRYCKRNMDDDDGLTDCNKSPSRVCIPNDF